MADFFIKEPFEIFFVEGDGFGIGGFGGFEEPFGSVGLDTIFDNPRDILIPPPRRGGVMLGGDSHGRERMVSVSIDTGVVDLGRTSHIDSCGIVCKSTRNLIFEGSGSV